MFLLYWSKSNRASFSPNLFLIHEMISSTIFLASSWIALTCSSPQVVRRSFISMMYLLALSTWVEILLGILVVSEMILLTRFVKHGMTSQKPKLAHFLISSSNFKAVNSAMVLSKNFLKSSITFWPPASSLSRHFWALSRAFCGKFLSSCSWDW